MHSVARYPSPMIALRATMLLRESGIPAWISAPDILPPFETHVFVAGDSMVPAAKELLASASPESLTPEAGWETAATPNIRVLDPKLAPACPGCNEILPLDPDLESCPRCGTPANITELLLERHGPEIFESLYPDEPDPGLEEALAYCHLACSCGYLLDGLRQTGACPECGKPFDKRVILGWTMRRP